MCGRVHFGPCCVNGTLENGKEGPMCMSCGRALTWKDRELIQRTWDTVNQLLAPYKRKASQ